MALKHRTTKRKDQYKIQMVDVTLLRSIMEKIKINRIMNKTDRNQELLMSTECGDKKIRLCMCSKMDVNKTSRSDLGLEVKG